MSAIKSLPTLIRVTALALPCMATVTAFAGPADKVYTPHSETGEQELEFRYGYEDADQGGNPWQGIVAYGYGVNERWKTEFAISYEDAAPNGDGEITGLEWENILVLTEPGQYWAHWGIFAELELNPDTDEFEVVLGPMFEKELNQEQFNFNLLFERELEDGTDTEMNYTAQWKHRGNKQVEFGAQSFGSFGELGDLGEEEEYKIGPALFGEIKAGKRNKLAWNGAVLVGANDDAPDLSVRFEVGYEMY